jgi:FKBP-type peptidyl-prolyl cis-trans isomerase FkpA
MKNFLMLLIAATLATTACSQKKEGVTPNGNKYILFNKGGKNARKLAENEFAVVQAYQYFNDSLMGSTRKYGKPEIVRLPSAGEIQGRTPAYIESLSLFGVGDSIVMFENMDSIRSMIPPQMSWVNSISFHLVMEKVMTKEEHEAMLAEEEKKMEAERQALMAQIPAIEGTLKEKLAAFKANSLGAALKSTTSGLQYIVLNEGTGAQVKAGESLDVHYYGALENGTRFDDSFSRGRPFGLQVGQGMVIPGWDEGLQLFKRGTKALLFIPYKLAYGEAGNPPVIPAKAPLVFYVDLQAK